MPYPRPDLLRYLRTQRRLRQSDLSEMLIRRVSPQLIGFLEQGRQAATSDVADDLDLVLAFGQHDRGSDELPIYVIASFDAERGPIFKPDHVGAFGFIRERRLAVAAVDLLNAVGRDDAVVLPVWPRYLRTLKGPARQLDDPPGRLLPWLITAFGVPVPTDVPAEVPA